MGNSPWRSPRGLGKSSRASRRMNGEIKTCKSQAINKSGGGTHTECDGAGPGDHAYAAEARSHGGRAGERRRDNQSAEIRGVATGGPRIRKGERRMRSPRPSVRVKLEKLRYQRFWTSRDLPPQDIQPGPLGRKTCTWCGGALPARRSRWCSDECRDEFQIRYSGTIVLHPLS